MPAMPHRPTALIPCPRLAATLLAGLLAGCAGQQPGSGSGTDAPPPPHATSPTRKAYPPPGAPAPPVAPDTQRQRLDRLQATLATSLRGREVELSRPNPTTLLLRIPAPMAFAANDAKPQPTLLPVLDQLAAALTQEPGATVEIEGHTDSLGREIFNQTLSIKRADSVVAYLTAKGVAFNRLTAVGMGESQPIADNATEAGRARNRRVDILIHGG